MPDGMGTSAKAPLGKSTYGARVTCGSARTVGARVCRISDGGEAVAGDAIVERSGYAIQQALRVANGASLTENCFAPGS